VYKATGGKTFAEVAADVLDARELEGIRGVVEERSVYRAHLATACFAEKPVDKIDATDIARWLRDMQAKQSARGSALSRGTIQRALSLASAVFVASGPQGSGLVSANPCAGMRVRTREARTEEPWTFLTDEEQAAIRDCQGISEADRLAILFAIGTGLRQGEQFHIELRDLHAEGDEPHVVVRFGSKGQAPKNGKIRRVPLFGLALSAARAWLRLLPEYCPSNPERLVFPSPKGHRRASSKPLGNMLPVPDPNGTHVLNGHRQGSRVRFVRAPKGQPGTHRFVDRFEIALRAAGITRDVRWHDLRHTCASSLVCGFWGEPWSLQEVREMLGHSSVTVTERYAHLGDTALKSAARKVAPMGGGLVRGNGGAGSSVACLSNDSEGVEQRGIEPLTSALRTQRLVESLRALTSEKGSSNPLATHLAEALASMLEAQS
jgi:integrase